MKLKRHTITTIATTAALALAGLGAPATGIAATRSHHSVLRHRRAAWAHIALMPRRVRHTASS